MQRKTKPVVLFRCLYNTVIGLNLNPINSDIYRCVVSDNTNVTDFVGGLKGNLLMRQMFLVF